VIVVDSSVWIDFFKGNFTPAASQLPELIRCEPVLVGDLVLCEVLKGARNSQHALVLEHTMRQCQCVTMLDADLARTAADNYRQLRSKGFTVRKTVDLIIGTFCIVNNYKLLHADRDFDAMEALLGLKVVPTHYMINEPHVSYG
jgi:predicted nucleic acid-binding protein